MGIYLNPRNVDFNNAVNHSEIYVDKTEMIKYTNKAIYNPRSVVMSMTGHDFDNYWTSTETYEALKIYIEMNFYGLKDTIIELLAGLKK